MMHLHTSTIIECNTDVPDILTISDLLAYKDSSPDSALPVNLNTLTKTSNLEADVDADADAKMTTIVLPEPSFWQAINS